MKKLSITKFEELKLAQSRLANEEEADSDKRNKT